MKADLHMHSIYSDGTMTVEELVKLGAYKGLDIMALTDHDSLKGVEEFSTKCKEYGIRAIKGVEITSNCMGQAVHILAYFKGEIPEKAYDFMEDMHLKRRKRALDMAKLLVDIYGLEMDIPKLERYEGNLTRGNLFREMISHDPSLDNQESFNKYLSSTSKAYIKSTELSPEDIIEYFKPLNCLLVIAHPTLYKKEVCDHLFTLDFDGLEAIYPRYEYMDQDYFLGVANNKNWLVTAGSDFHGKIDFSHRDMASVYLTSDYLNNFLERIDNL